MSSYQPPDPEESRAGTDYVVPESSGNELDREDIAIYGSLGGALGGLALLGYGFVRSSAARNPDKLEFMLENSDTLADVVSSVL